MTYRHSVGWANDPTSSDCHVIDHTVAHLFSCPTHPTGYTDAVPRIIPPGGYVDSTFFQVAQFQVGLSQFFELPTVQVNFDSLPP